jgi:hypothetical protein
VTTFWQDDPSGLVRIALREWSDSLVNLTGANRLLRLRPSRTGTIEIVRPSAEEILSGLEFGAHGGPGTPRWYEPPTALPPTRRI